MSKHAVCAEIHTWNGYIDFDSLLERYTPEEVIDGIGLWWEDRQAIKNIAKGNGHGQPKQRQDT